MVRVNYNTVKKWGVSLGISGTSLVALVFIYLSFFGYISIDSYSNDMVCAGTLNDPCYAYINFTANENIFLYPTNLSMNGDGSPFTFNHDLKDWKLELMYDNEWKEIDLSNKCSNFYCGAKKEGEESAYSISFLKGNKYMIRLVGFKEDPLQTVKWGAFGVIDPEWKSINEDTFFTELKEVNADDLTSVFEFNNIYDKDLPEEDLSINFNTVCGDVVDYTFEYKTNCTREIKTPIFKKVEVCGVKKEETYTPLDYVKPATVDECYIEEIIEDYSITYETYECWQETDKLPIGVRDYRLKVVPKISNCGDSWGYKIDWVPTLKTTNTLTGEVSELTKKEWAWFNSTWSYRTAITISENSGSAVTNYPVKINLNSSNFDFSLANTTGKDLRFAYENGTILAIFNESYNSTHAELWTKLNLTANSNTIIYLYYGNPSANSVFNAESVFGSGIISFWDFDGDTKDVISGTSATIVGDVALTTDRDGNANSAYYFPGTTDYMIISHNDKYEVSNVSLAVWAKPKSGGISSQAHGKILSFPYASGWTAPYASYSFGAFDTSASDYELSAFHAYSSTSFEEKLYGSQYVPNTWQFWVYTIDGSISAMRINNVGGVSVANSGGIYYSANNQNLTIGTHSSTALPGSENYYGDMDRLMLYNKTLSLIEKNNLYVTSEPTVVSVGIAEYQRLELNATNHTSFGDTDLSNFSAVVSLNNSQIYTPYKEDSAACYPLDGDAVDYCNTNYGTLYGYTSNNGTCYNGVTISDDAMRFDGSNDYVDIGSTILSENQSFTISTWIYANAFHNDTGLAYYSGLVTQGKVRLTLRGMVGDIMNQVSFGYDSKFLWTSGGLSTGEWYNIVAVYNHSEEKGYLYVNGVLNKSDIINASNEIGLGDLKIGRDTYNTVAIQSYFNGSISNVKIYNRPLSAGEIQSEYSAGRSSYAVSGNGLVAQYSGKDYAGTESAPTTIYDTNRITKGVWDGSKAMNFDGNNDYVGCGNDSSLNFGTGNFSIAVWFKMNRLEGFSGIIDKGATSDTESGYIIRQINGNQIQASIGNGSSRKYAYEGGFVANEWYHFVAVVDRTDKLKLFVNGTEGNSVDISTLTGSVDNNLNLQLGRQGSSLWFNGSIDDVRIYNRALSADEIQAIYNSTNKLHYYSTTTGVIKTSIDTTAEANITYISKDYISRTYTGITTNVSFHTGELWQAEAVFTAYDTSSNVITPFNVTINGVTQLDSETWYLSAGNYNATFSKVGWFNKTIEINVVAGTSSTYNFTGITPDFWLFNGTVVDESGVPISGVTVLIISQLDNTVKATIQSNATGGWSYNITTIGNYTVVAYDQNNKTRYGTAEPFIECAGPT